MSTGLLIRFRARTAIWLLSWMPDLVIDGHLPGRTGRYRVVDTLIFWSENDGGI